IDAATAFEGGIAADGAVAHRHVAVVNIDAATAHEASLIAASDGEAGERDGGVLDLEDRADASTVHCGRAGACACDGERATKNDVLNVGAGGDLDGGAAGVRHRGADGGVVGPT